MDTAQLEEKSRKLILDTIQAGISAQLNTLAINRDDGIVSLESPSANSYFIYDGANTYECPAVFLVVDEESFPEDEGINYVKAVINMYLSIVVEDKEQELLTIKTERYKAALYNLLHFKTLSDPAQNVKIRLWLKNAKFSPTYTKKGFEVFRKEVSILIEVKHYENPF